MDVVVAIAVAGIVEDSVVVAIAVAGIVEDCMVAAAVVDSLVDSIAVAGIVEDFVVDVVVVNLRQHITWRVISSLSTPINPHSGNFSGLRSS